MTKLTNDIAADASFIRSAWARGDTDTLWCQLTNASNVDGVITEDLHLRAKLAKVLDEVVGKGIVVIDDLFTVSSYS